MSSSYAGASTDRTMDPRVSIVIPAYNEAGDIVPVIERLMESVTLSYELLVVVDFPEDSTVPFVEGFADPAVRVLVQTYGRGPANAIRYGLKHASARVAIVTMADGCDDPRQIDDLARLVERGVVVAAASRYMPGGAQVGGSFFKSLMSRTAGRSLFLFARIGTRDATNSFKAYNTDFVREVGVDSRAGFEIGLELAAKAKRLGRPIAEIPTIWLDRTAGVSNFKLKEWLPVYLRWYRFAFGRPMTLEALTALRARLGHTDPSDVDPDLLSEIPEILSETTTETGPAA